MSDESFSARKWIRKKAVTLTLIMTTIIAVAGGSAAWDTLGLPKVAFKSDVKEIRIELSENSKFDRGTRAILLDNSLDRAGDELEKLDDRLVQEPSNIDLRARIRAKRRSIRNLEIQIRQLENSDGG